MTFHSPHLLWLLVPLVLLFSWELARHRTQAAALWPKIARAWAGAFSVSLGARHTTADNRPRIWLWFGLACCLVALARPQWGVVEEQVFDQSREVVIAVDLSRSMLAQDVKPSRLDRSKLLITSLLDGLKGERVGLVLFAGTAFLQSPLSADYEVLREFLPALKPDYLPEGGSNYKAMLETAIDSFGTSTADRYLIILSDGESTEEGWKDLGEKLKTKGIRVIGLGVGTPVGAFIPDGTGAFVKDERGAVVMSRLNSATLQELAQLTGGAYTDASTWIDLGGLLKSTVESGKKGEFSEKSTSRRVERFQWFLAPGLALLLLSFWTEFPIRPRERTLPLAGRAKPKALSSQLSNTIAAFGVLLTAYSLSPKAFGAEGTEDPLAKPLTATVARLATKGDLAAKDYADLAQTTVTFGQRMKSSQQPPPEGVVRDGLAAVDAGEKLDAQAADWPRLRQELEELLQKPEPPEQKPEEKNQDQQQKQDQQKQNDQQKQDQQKQQDSSEQKQEQPDQNQQQQSSEQKKQDQDAAQQKQQQQDAFGDMQEPPQPPDPKEQTPPPQPSKTQKVGGQKEKKAEEPADPALAMPLQKLDQVRNQDSPAKLHQLMQGQQQKPAQKGKDW